MHRANHSLERGAPPKDAHHSTLSKTRDRLPIEVHELAFRLVLAAAAERGLLKGKTLGVDSTTLEAGAAVRSIVRKGSGEGWKACVKRLMQEAGQIEEGDEPSKKTCGGPTRSGK